MNSNYRCGSCDDICEDLIYVKTEIEKYYGIQLQKLIEPVKYPLFEDGSSANQHYGQLDCSPFEMKI